MKLTYFLNRLYTHKKLKDFFQLDFMEMDRFPTKKSLPDEEDVDDNLIIEQNKNQRKKRQAPYLIFPEILCIIDYDGYRYILDILFRQITTFFKVRVAFVLGLQTP